MPLKDHFFDALCHVGGKYLCFLALFPRFFSNLSGLDLAGAPHRRTASGSDRRKSAERGEGSPERDGSSAGMDRVVWKAGVRKAVQVLHLQFATVELQRK